MVLSYTEQDRTPPLDPSVTSERLELTIA